RAPPKYVTAVVRPAATGRCPQCPGIRVVSPRYAYWMAAMYSPTTLRMSSGATLWSRLPPLPEHLQRHLHSSEWGAHLHPLHAALHLLEHLAGDLHPFGERGFFPLLLRPAHALQHLGRHHDTGDLVGEELGVAQADERPDPRHDRNAVGFHPLQEALQLAHVEHRLGDGELRARVHLPVEPGKLAVQLDGAGVHADADRPTGGRADRVVAGVEPGVEPVHQVREPGPVDRVA